MWIWSTVLDGPQLKTVYLQDGKLVGLQNVGDIQLLVCNVYLTEKMTNLLCCNLL